MSDGFDGHFHLKPASGVGRAPLHSGQREHLFQDRRPGRRRRFPYLSPVAIHGHGDARGGCRHLRRQLELLVQHFHFFPVDLDADDLARGSSRLFFPQGGLPHERPFLDLDEPAQSHLERRILLARNERLATAEKIDLDQEQAGLDPRDVEREHAGRPQIVRPACRNEGIPHPRRTIPRHPDFIAEIAGVSRA